MIIPRIIFYFNILAWLLPPLRQKGHKYFLYFLILALSDPVRALLNLIHPFDATSYYLVISTLTLIAILRKKFYYILLLLVALIIIFFNNYEIGVFSFLVHFVIILLFLKDLIILISGENVINIFNLVLVLYEASVLFKFAATYFSIGGYLFFYITTAFEIFIAIFFTIYNEKNSPVIKLQMEPKEYS
jgi:hypothetical protein